MAEALSPCNHSFYCRKRSNHSPEFDAIHHWFVLDFHTYFHTSLHSVANFKVSETSTRVWFKILPNAFQVIHLTTAFIEPMFLDGRGKKPSLIIPASRDEGLRDRHGRSPDTNEKVTQLRELSEVENSQNDVKNLKQGCQDNDVTAPHRMYRA